MPDRCRVSVGPPKSPPPVTHTSYTVGQRYEFVATDALAAAIPGVAHSFEDTPQKNTKEYLDLLVSAQRDLAQHTLTWSAWNKLTVCSSAKVKALAEPVTPHFWHLTEH